MMQHQVLHIDQYPRARFALGITITTPRGIFTGLAERRQIHTAADRVDVWHPVPRWMRPWQVLEPFLEA